MAASGSKITGKFVMGTCSQRESGEDAARSRSSMQPACAKAAAEAFRSRNISTICKIDDQHRAGFSGGVSKRAGLCDIRRQLADQPAELQTITK
jgi:hypothetical protein